MITPPAPPMSTAIIRQADVVTFDASAIVCEDGRALSDLPIAPDPTTIVRYGAEAATPPAYRLTFAIGDDGRPRTIRPDAQPFVPGLYVDTSDLAPALAAARFPRGMARRGCSIAYTVRLVPVAIAPLRTIYALASSDMQGAATSDIQERVRPAGSDCDRGPGSPRQLNYPDFDAIEGLPHARSWTFLTYDVDRQGRAVDVRIVASDGNAALDRASLAALAANRYTAGPARHGCTYHFYRNAARPVEPPLVPSDAPADNGNLPACALDPKTITDLLNGDAYPSAFMRRQIEGFAVIGYDTAPWGATGNLTIIASEPAEAFGNAARSALSNAKVATSEAGHRGCVSRIFFRLPPSPAFGAGRAGAKGGRNAAR